jgi:NADPH-dependent curcumin reductase
MSEAVVEDSRTPGAPNRQWLVSGPVEGTVRESNFRWAESPIPSPGPGQALVRNLWFSFDPTQVLSIATPPESGGTPPGGVMRSLAVSEVVSSRLPEFQPGDLVHGHSGWEDYSLTDGHGFFETTKVPAGVPPNLALGTLGVTGMVAFFGMLEVGRPQKGETCVVSAAAGGVGSIATQIARIYGTRVIGIAGGPAKCEWLVKDAGASHAIDHRSEDVAARLDALCPDGIDLYFDNVGGPVLDMVLDRLGPRGRIVLCGVTSGYLETSASPGLSRYTNLIMRNGRMEGILGKDYASRFSEALPVLQGWLRSGELKSKEDVAEGLENAPRTLARMFSGENVGKQLLHLADPSPGRPD